MTLHILYLVAQDYSEILNVGSCSLITTFPSRSLSSTSLKKTPKLAQLNVAFLPFMQDLKKGHICLYWHHYEFVASKFSWVFRAEIDVSLIYYFAFSTVSISSLLPPRTSHFIILLSGWTYTLLPTSDTSHFIGIPLMCDSCITNSPANITIGPCFPVLLMIIQSLCVGSAAKLY